jgi:carboxylesterase type B
VFIHGGYWQFGTVFESCFMAANFLNKNVTVVALGYDVAPSGISINLKLTPRLKIN